MWIKVWSLDIFLLFHLTEVIQTSCLQRNLTKLPLIQNETKTPSSSPFETKNQGWTQDNFPKQRPKLTPRHVNPVKTRPEIPLSISRMRRYNRRWSRWDVWPQGYLYNNRGDDSTEAAGQTSVCVCVCNAYCLLSYASYTKLPVTPW